MSSRRKENSQEQKSTLLYSN
ncbi:UNVERIFIED_CONTAM: hypothetical protein NCL1_29425 [Trichonephila clavipes]